MIDTAWIESHQALGHHPKTLRLATALNCSVPAAVGYVHFLWWWALDYAPDGVVPPAEEPVVARACEWHGKAERFWAGLLEARFVDRADGTLHIHDWLDYAGRLVGQRAANRARSERTRNANRSRSARERVREPSGATYRTNQPETGAPTPVSLTNQPPNPLEPIANADAQGAPPTASASDPESPIPRWEEVAPGQHRGHPNGQGEVTLLKVRCPRCDAWMLPDAFDEHVCELVPGDQVQTGSRPGNLGGFLPRRHTKRPTPPEVEEELRHMATHRPSAEEIAAEVERIAAAPPGKP